jgi:phosphoribosylanthranilate isomerase
MNELLIKVCGLTSLQQIRELEALDLPYLGLIFAPSSPRYVEHELDLKTDTGVKFTGVFVNSPLEQVLYAQSRYHLQAIQLHGQESPDFCAQIQSRGLEVMKAFSIDKSFDFSKVEEFDGYADYFLFDTKGDAAGGNGIRFDWSLLQEYQGATPFLLSGGISYEHIDEIRYFKHPAWIGIDINSRFEKSPGTKDIPLIKKFIHELRSGF